MKRVSGLYKNQDDMPPLLREFLVDVSKLDDADNEFDIGCRRCHKALDFDVTFAFQPIVDLSLRKTIGYEALVRGVNQESAYDILQRVTAEKKYAFDQVCRYEAIKLAGELGLGDKFLSINFNPNSIYNSEHCIRTTLLAAEKFGIPETHLMFEVTESEKVIDREHLARILSHYSSLGFRTAIDDFGEGHAGLNLLVEFTPDIVKIDRLLISGIDYNKTKQIVVKNLVQTLVELGVHPLAEGVETKEELQYLRYLGVQLFQGFYFAKPQFQTFPEVDWERTF